jgi:hypothetical protein
LYAELYLGLCRALATPWLPPRPVHADRGAPPPAQSSTAREASAAGPTAATPAISPATHAISAQIISFERARARLARREAG